MIELKNVGKEYKCGRDSVVALRDVNLLVEKGEWIAITGPSGSGKSTLLSLMGGLIRCTSGAVYVEGEQVDGLSPQRMNELRRERIGFVFQLFHLVPYLSILDNICLASHDSDAGRARVKATELATSFGLESRLAHRPGKLSVGERQRAALARALINDPQIVLADEPTGNLDQSLAARVLDDFRKLAKEGKTIVLVTHDDQAARHADRHLHLSAGQLS